MRDKPFTPKSDGDLWIEQIRQSRYTLEKWIEITAGWLHRVTAAIIDRLLEASPEERMFYGDNMLTLIESPDFQDTPDNRLMIVSTYMLTRLDSDTLRLVKQALEHHISLQEG